MIEKDIIAKRSNDLEKVRDYLKREFIGIDDVIDKFIESVRLWYIIPEFLNRPVIINLWGITGVGKTDLVRKFVKAINYNDKFTEIQMDSKSGTATIQDYLETTFESNKTHGILLLDEIQRFRTIDMNGDENNSSKYQDLWMLLSDGRFQSNSEARQELIRMLVEDKYYNELDMEEEDDDDESVSKGDIVDALIKDASKNGKKNKKKERTYKMSWWSASRLRKLLNLDCSVEDVMKWDENYKNKIIKERLNSNTTYEGKKYSKLLIIISGNLDEAFTMSNDVNVTDLNADIYHEFSKSVDIIKIKGALRERFKPEQIARFGNNHIIYPIPNKLAYEKIIKQKVDSIVNNIKKEHNISVDVDESVLEVIYDNGVFPTQGVRPVISTVSIILENALPIFIFKHLSAVDSGGYSMDSPIKLSYNGKFIESNINGEKIEYEVPTDIYDIKEKQSDNNKSMVAVHEAGHSVVYTILFNTCPSQIVITSSDEFIDGFMGKHKYVGTKSQILNDVKVALAGRIAEELIFGKNNVTAGAASDLIEATNLVSEYIRKYAMGDNIGVYDPLPKNSGRTKVSIEETDEYVELILNKLYQECTSLLETHIRFLLEVVEKLLETDNLSPVEYRNIAVKHLGRNDIKILSPNDEIEHDFDSLLKEKIKQYKNGKL